MQNMMMILWIVAAAVHVVMAVAVIYAAVQLRHIVGRLNRRGPVDRTAPTPTIGELEEQADKEAAEEARPPGWREVQ